MLSFLQQLVVPSRKKVDVEIPQKQAMVCWFEIPASDFSRAVRFYKEVFEIKIKEVSMNEKMHGIFQLNDSEAISGAILEVPDLSARPEGAVLYFDANPDMTEVLMRIQANGGKILTDKTLIKNQTSQNQAIVPKTMIDGDLGYFAYFQDSEGNKMGLYSNS